MGLKHLKQHKKFSAAIVIVIILITILAGAFAWYTFSQNRINTFELSATAPNVNLHDDFAGGPEKDVYVENSGDFNVLVRVRLSELIKRGNDLTPENAVDDDNAFGWHVHTPSADGCAVCDFEAHNYFDWTMDGYKFYMPAHNSAKGSDSVEPLAIGDKEAVIDYAALLKGAFTEVYASDQNALDAALALMDAYLGGDDTIAADLMVEIASIPDTYTVIVKQHTNQPESECLRRLNEVRLTLIPSQIITMQDWINGTTYGTPLFAGDFWVVDADGWYYWANALAPNSATGQLLSAVTYKNNYSNGEFTYKINVHLNATSLDGTSLAAFFLIAEQNGGVSDDAMILMFLASGEYIFGEDGEIYHNEGGGFYRKINKNNDRYVNYTLGEQVYAQPGSLPGGSGGLSVGGQLGLDEDGNVTEDGDYVIEAIVPGENGVVYLDVGGGVYLAPVDESGSPDNGGEKYAIVHTGTDGQTGNDDDIGPVRAVGSFPQWYFVDITDVTDGDVIEAGQKGSLIRANNEAEIPLQTFSVQQSVYRVQSITRGENGLLYLKLDEDLYAVALNAHANPVNLTMSEVWGTDAESGEQETVPVPSTYYIIYPAESGKIGTENDTTDITPVISAQPVAISGVYDGAAKTLSVTSSGAGTHHYQWYKDTTPIAGAVSNMLEVIDVADSGDYYCTITADVKGHSFASVNTDTVTVSITKRLITITADSDEKMYDGDELTHNSYTITSGSIAGGDSLDVTCTGAITGVGTVDNVISTYTITRAEDDVTENYTVTTQYGTLSVTKRPLTITAGSASKDYDGTPLTENSYTISGTLANGDTLSVTVSGSIIDFGTEENVISAYTIMRSGVDVTANYNVTTVNGVLTVAQQTLTITAGSTSKVYDGTPLTYSNYTTSGALASGDILSVTVTGSRTDAGTADNVISAYTITRAGIDVTASYTVTTIKGSLTVSAKPLTAAMLNVTGTYIYTGVAQPPTYTVIDGLPLTNGIHYHNVTVTNHTNAGTAKIEITGTGNYQGTVSKNFTIGKAALTVTALNRSVTYSATAPANDVSYNGFVNGETKSVLSGTLAYDCTYTTASNVGGYAIMPKGLTAANYAIEFKPGMLTVNAKALTDAMLTVTNSYTYTGTQIKPTFTVIDGTTINVANYDVSYGANINAGTNVGYVTITGKGNYTSTATRNFTIGKAALTITANNQSVTYRDAIPPYSVSYNGFVNSQNQTVLGGTLAYDCIYTATSNATTYPITPKGLTSTNYAIEFKTGTLTVNRKALSAATVINVTSNHTYSGSAQTPTFTVTDGGVGLAVTTNYTASYSNNTNAGTATITLTGTGNYQGTATRNFTIDKRPITLTAGSATKEYDGTALTNNTANVTVGALASGESVSSVVTTGTITDVGTVFNAISSCTIMRSSTDTTSNYTVTPATGTLTITNPFSSGTGTSASPFLITSKADLEKLRNKVNASANFSTGKYFKQTANIDLGGVLWTPIGTGVNINADVFAGTYDGNGYTISGLNVSTVNTPAGLFGQVFGGSVANLGVRGNVKATGSPARAGGIVGLLGKIEKNEGVFYASLSNCVFTGTVEGYQTGGIVGYAAVYNSSVSNCMVTYGSEVKGSSVSGGIVGYLGYGTIKNSYSLAKLTSTGTVGGVLGGMTSGTLLNSAFLRTATLNSTLNAAGSGTASAVGYFDSPNSDLSATNSTTITAGTKLLALLNNGQTGTPWIQTNAGVSWPVLSAINREHDGWDGRADSSLNNVIDGYIIISHPVEFASLVNYVNSSTYNNYLNTRQFKLTADIDLNGMTIDPCGISETLTFRTEFDGNGYTIKGLNIQADGDAGLFGFIDGATIKNLKVEGNVSSKSRSAGGIAAMSISGSTAPITIQNCSFTGNVFSPANSFSIGGIIASTRGKSFTMENCYVGYGSRVFSNAGVYIGGLCGASLLGTDTQLNIKNCYSLAQVSATGYKGGMFVLFGNSSYLTLSRNAFLRTDSFNNGLDAYTNVSGSTTGGSLIGCFSTGGTGLTNTNSSAGTMPANLLTLLTGDSVGSGKWRAAVGTENGGYPVLTVQK